MAATQTTFTTETVNGVEVLFDDQGRFNVSKLVKKYQPKNIHINRYIQSKKFAELFGAKSLEYQQSLSLPPTGNLKFEAVIGKGKEQGLYLPRQFLHIILMMLDPNYRTFANAVLEAVNVVNDGSAPVLSELQIKNTRTQRLAELDPNSYQWRVLYCCDIADPLERERKMKQLDDKMW